MRYPANYGFIPHTLGDDGDPLDCLVVARSPFMPGCVVRVRPIAVLILEDEAGGDEKILAVPDQSTFPLLRECRGGRGPAAIVRQQIEHFFTHYKDLEPEKWVRVGHWGVDVDVPAGVRSVEARFDYLSDTPGDIGRTEMTPTSSTSNGRRCRSTRPGISCGRSASARP
jgi:hypothetical protein